MMATIASLVFSCLLPFVGNTTDAVLTVEVDRIQDVTGHMFIAVYDSEDSFMNADLAFKSTKVAVTSTDFRWTCELPIGEYAVVIFHDIDDNGKLNTSGLGLPKEPYGFSNNARGLFGPPGFSQSAVSVAEDTTISITLR